MSLTLSLFVVLVCSLSLGFSSDALAPVYTVSLDLPLEQRWAKVMADYSAVCLRTHQGGVWISSATNSNNNFSMSQGRPVNGTISIRFAAKEGKVKK